MKKLLVMFLAALMLMLPAAQAAEIGGGLNSGMSSGNTDTTEEVPAQPDEAPGSSIGGGLGNIFNSQFPAAQPADSSAEEPAEAPAVEITYADVPADGDWYYQRALELAEFVGAAASDSVFMDTYGPGLASPVVAALSAVDFASPIGGKALKGGSMDIARESAWQIYNFGYEAATVYSQWDALYTLDSASYILEDDASDVNLWTSYMAAYVMPAGFEAQIIVLEYDCCCVGVQFIDSGEAVLAKAMLYPTSDNCTVGDVIDELLFNELYTGPYELE